MIVVRRWVCVFETGTSDYIVLFLYEIIPTLYWRMRLLRKKEKKTCGGVKIDHKILDFVEEHKTKSAKSVITLNFPQLMELLNI